MVDGFDSTNLGGLTKNIYGPAELKELYALSSSLLSRIQKHTGSTLGGAGFIFGVKTKNNNGGRFVDPEAVVPEALPFEVRQATVSPKTYVITNEVSALAADIASGNLSSFVPVVTEAISDAMATAAADHEVAVFSNAYGKLGTIASVATAVLTMTDGIHNFRIGMPVDAVDTAGSKVGSSTTVTDVDYAANTVTVAVATSFAATNSLYKVGQGITAAAAFSFNGLAESVAATGSYLGIDPATYPRWVGNVKACAGAPLDEDMIESAKVRLMQEQGSTRGSLTNNVVILNPRQYRQLALESGSRRRFESPSVVLGTSSVALAGMGEIIESHFAPEDVVYLGNLDELCLFETPTGSLRISNDLGAPDWRFDPTYLKAKMIIRSFSNICVTNRKSWMALTGLGNSLSR